MKLKTCLLLFVICFVVACKKDANTANNKNAALAGKWNYVGSYLSIGGPLFFQPAATAGITTFSSNGSLQSTAIFTNYNKYTVNDASDVTLFGSNNLQEDFSYNIKGDTLRMSSKVNMCVEGCAIVLVKMQ